MYNRHNFFCVLTGLEDWDIVRPADVSPKSVSAQLLEKTGILGNITGSITTQVGKTVSQAAKVMGKSTASLR